MTNKKNFGMMFELLQNPIYNPTRADLQFMEWFEETWCCSQETLTWLIECTNYFELECIGGFSFNINYFCSNNLITCLNSNSVILTLYHIGDEYSETPLNVYSFDLGMLKAHRDMVA